MNVGKELAVDGVGNPSFEAAHRLHAGLTGDLASVVGLAFGVEPDLGGRCDVEHVVGLAVTGAGEAVSDLFAGGGVERGGAGPGGEAVVVGAAGNVPNVDEDSSGDDRADAGKFLVGGF